MDGPAAMRTRGEVVPAHVHVVWRIAVLAVPDRNAMTPPELPRDVPVSNVLEPVHVHAFPLLREDPDGAVAQPLECGFRQRFHLHEPLVREARLDHGVGAVAVS